METLTDPKTPASPTVPTSEKPTALIEQELAFLENQTSQQITELFQDLELPAINSEKK